MTLRRREVHLTRENLVTKFSTIRLYVSFALIYIIPVDGHFGSPSGREKPNNIDRKELANE